MIISVINQTHGKISDAEVEAAIRAINRQVSHDFANDWGLGATLRLEGNPSIKPGKQTIASMRGDAVMYLWDGNDVPGALSYHHANSAGIPYGFVFTELARKLKESWTRMLSHEVLEIIGDPEVNLLVQGPHPVHPDQAVFYGREMCDAVQAESYQIDGIDVSNFVLPSHFTGGEELGGRNDFLGRSHRGKTLRSFGINPGGYIGFYNPAPEKTKPYANRGDKAAAQRIKLKQAAGKTRRTVRHQTFTQANNVAR